MRALIARSAAGRSPQLRGTVGLDDLAGPPDGDYARYVEQLLLRADGLRAAAPAAMVAPAGRQSAPSTPPMPPGAPAGAPPADAPARSQARTTLGRWPLLLWGLFVLLMWVAPGLLPVAIGLVVAGGVGHGIWKARAARRQR